MSDGHRTKGILLATLTAVLWGFVPVAGKVALGGMSAPVLSVLRLAVAGAVLSLLLARSGIRPFRRPPRLVYLAALGLGGNYLCYMAGLEFAGAGTSQVLIQTAPLFLILLGVLFLGERPTGREFGAGVMAFLGVGLVSWQEMKLGEGGTLGVVLILVSALAWAMYAAAHKHLGRRHASGGTMMWIFLFAALAVAPSAPFAPGRHPDGVEMAAIVFLCVNTIVAYWAFAEALRHISATTAAVIATLGPAVTFGLLLVTNGLEQAYVAYEPITGVKLAGAILVVTGVVLAVTGPDRDRL